MFVIAQAVAQTPDPNFHIYLLFGQSNMEGAGTIENQDKTGVNARFRVMGALTCTGTRPFTYGQWADATPPLVRCYTGLGIGDYFGRTMVEDLPTHIKVGLVPVAVGGCDIGLFDKVNYAFYANNAPQWMKDIIAQYGGNPYARLIATAKLAQKDGVIKGILFHQGETNTNNPDWKDKVKQVVENIKIDLGLGDVPFLAGELLASQGACCSVHNVEVNKLPGLIPNTHVISSVDLTGTDNAHFTSASYRTFGERYAKKMHTLIEVDSNPVTAVDNQPEEKSIEFYPTPIRNGSVTIANIEDITQVEVFNLVGERIVWFDNLNRSSSVDLQLNTAPGILLLKLSSEKKKPLIKKLFVQ